jgi:hypothetical protein
MRRKKTMAGLSRTGPKASTENCLRLLRENENAPTISALMRSLKHVKSSGPYIRDEMNER